MLDIVLFEPEIPPNTGNIIRLCANIGYTLHLIEPLGFDIDAKKLRRAGLDYHEMTNVNTYPNLDSYLQKQQPTRLLALTTKARQSIFASCFCVGDSLLFGPETRGLPQHVLDNLPEAQKLKIPMQTDSRSLNLSNAVAIVSYEALRQIQFSDTDQL